MKWSVVSSGQLEVSGGVLGRCVCIVIDGWPIQDIHMTYSDHTQDIHRTCTGHTHDIYRTNTGHAQDIQRTYTGHSVGV